MSDPSSDSERLSDAAEHNASEIEFESVPPTSPRHGSAKLKPHGRPPTVPAGPMRRPRRQPRTLVGAASWTGTSAISFVGASQSADTAIWSAPWPPSAGAALARQIAAVLWEMLPASPAPPAELSTALPEVVIDSFPGAVQRKLLKALNGKDRVPLDAVLTAVYGTKNRDRLDALLQAVLRANRKLAEAAYPCTISKEGETLRFARL